jgi:hypothetical protein
MLTQLTVLNITVSTAAADDAVYALPHTCYTHILTPVVK